MYISDVMLAQCVARYQSPGTLFIIVDIFILCSSWRYIPLVLKMAFVTAVNGPLPYLHPIRILLLVVFGKDHVVQHGKEVTYGNVSLSRTSPCVHHACTQAVSHHPYDFVGY